MLTSIQYNPEICRKFCFVVILPVEFHNKNGLKIVDWKIFAKFALFRQLSSINFPSQMIDNKVTDQDFV